MAHSPQDETTSAAPSTLDLYLALSHIGSASGPLAPLAGEEPEETPRLYIAHTATGEWRVFIRPDVPMAIRHQLATLAPETLFTEHARVAALLAQDAVDAITEPGAGLWIGRTLLFPDDLTPTLARAPQHDILRLWPDGDHYGAPAPGAARLWSGVALREEPPPRDVFPGEQFAIVVDDLVVATCESSRESELAAEAWVRTLPAARGRGYATRVTAAWALDARHRGKIPFYSHHRANAASAGVARALGLIPFLEDVGYL